MMDRSNCNILWTGGWDSTFQLLQLLLVERKQVTPFYLLDENRQSTGIEIRTRMHIKQMLMKIDPQVGELLQPTRFFAVSDLAPDSEITGAYQSIIEDEFIGGQYDWFARYCKQHEIADMQLCIHLDDRAHHIVDRIVRKSADDSRGGVQIDPKYEDRSEYKVFRYFTYPIFNLSKVQMSDIAKQQGWEEIMGMTWFCHNPKKMKPCGVCNPCLYTIEEGFGWRIPKNRQIISFLYRKLFLSTKAFIKSLLEHLGLLKYVLNRRNQFRQWKTRQM